MEATLFMRGNSGGLERTLSTSSGMVWVRVVAWPLNKALLCRLFCYSERFGGFRKLGYLFRGPNIKDYSILGSILGSPHFGKVPFLSDLPFKKIALANTT